MFTGVLAWRNMGSASVVIEWSTASELDTAGFNLYRASSPDGSYEKINASLIPASDDPLSGGQYSYKDTGVIPGRRYYYLLEDVEYSGQATSSGPTEVVARGSSNWEMLLAVLLLALSLYGLLITRPRRVPAARIAEDLHGMPDES